MDRNSKSVVTTMTQQEYLEHILTTYRIVHVMAVKNGCRVLRLRNRHRSLYNQS